jgi:hypothetical protein
MVLYGAKEKFSAEREQEILEDIRYNILAI